MSIFVNAAISLPRSIRSGRTSAGWLAENLGAKWLRVVDVRGDSADTPARSRAEEDDPPRYIELGPRAGWLRAGVWSRRARPPEPFTRAHIPGSASLDVGRRLFDDAGAIVCAPELAMAMSEIGVGDEHTVVLVDEGVPGAAMVAAWILRHYGHAETLVLAGGFPRWLAEGRPVTREVVRHPSGSFTARTPS